ncbi:MAG: J domain-containing protein [Paludibacteraceae bacterium]|nr:J domain-containing protein [Paludibacteraceae bacterium]
MSETTLILIYVLAFFTLPFGIAFALRFFVDKRKDNQEEESSGTSNSYGSANSYSNAGRSNNYTKQKKKASYYNSYQSSQNNRKSNQRSGNEPIMTGGGKNARNRIFQANTILHGEVIYDESVKRNLYTSAISVVALFSWVMRKDGGADDEELDVAQLYFEKHPALNRILRLYPDGLDSDPISGAEHVSVSDCMRRLKFYNTCPKMLRYSICCDNILASGIYYTAVMDLMKALLQVAYTTDGVIESEWEILRGIAQKLKIQKVDWTNLEQRYTQMGWNPSSSQKKSSSGKKKSEKRKTDREQSKRQENNRSQGQQQKQQQNQQQDQTKKSSTFGYKLTQAYNQLGLLTTATEPEIKAAFRLLAKKYHPDRLPSDATDMDRKISADQFRQVMEAYDLIRLEKGM